MRRSTTLLALLYSCMSDGIDLATVHPRLYQSILRIYVHHVPQATRQAEALENFRISCRGGLRKPPSVITFWGTMLNLSSLGDHDNAGFVRSWNAGVAKTHHMVGQKATTLKLFLEFCPKPAQEFMQTYVGEVGYSNSFMTDDNMATKKIFPSFQFKCLRSKHWTKRLKTTDESMLLMLRRAASDHKASGRKPDRSCMEDSARFAAIAWNLGQEVQQEYPIGAAKVNEQFYDPYANGCRMIGQDILAVSIELDDKFHLTDIQALKDIVQRHTAEKPTAGPASETMAAIEQDSYNLKMKEMSYDMQVFRVYKEKFELHQNAIYHKKRSWATEQRETATKKMSEYLEKCVKFVIMDSYQDVVQQRNEFRQHIREECRIEPAGLLSLGYLNWCSPSLIHKQVMDTQCNMLGKSLYDSEDNMALVLLPVFSYKKTRHLLCANIR